MWLMLSTMSLAPTEQRADAVRRFNRFYTRRIGALGNAHLGSEFSLTDMRVLYELAHRDRPTASEIGEALGLDRGYLSRTLRHFRKRGWIDAAHGEDRRRRHLTLTAAGKKAFAPLERGARADIVTMLEPLDDEQQTRVLEAMRTIREALGDAEAAASEGRRDYTLRAHRPGDMGMIVHRHGVIYAKEFGYDERFEALVAKVVGGFIENFKPRRERCWIAERDGRFLGSVMVVEKKKSVAQLRLLIVEPTARGLGIGRRLVDEVIRFSRKAGYRRLQLWTQSELTAARNIYRAAGFRIVGHEGHESFGKKLEAEVWELALK
jgi:DNA-binding MarR family transcriptional regulator/N-acetylglutamate synthase-like GNAT family acetyltransferase